MAGKTLRGPIEYPVSDGKPMGETDLHAVEMQEYVIEVLKDRFAAKGRVYVSGNNFLYFEQGVPSACVCPDCYVVKGVPKRLRDCYKVWEEGGRTPCFVLEVTSKKTHREDKGKKKAAYAERLRVPEYFLFDPTRDWIPEGLRGYVLEGDEYRTLDPVPSARLASRELGLELGIRDGHVRFFERGREDPLPTRVEARARAEATGEAKALLILLESRFGRTSQALRRRIADLRDPSMLTRLLRIAATCRTQAEVSRALDAD